MKIISYNVKSLNAPYKHMMLQKRINNEKPSILMLQEMKCDKITLIWVAQNIWKKCEIVVVEAKDTSGRLAIPWDLEI
jgi:exonuclease III